MLHDFLSYNNLLLQHGRQSLEVLQVDEEETQVVGPVDGSYERIHGGTEIIQRYGDRSLQNDYLVFTRLHRWCLTKGKEEVETQQAHTHITGGGRVPVSRLYRTAQPSA